MLGLSFEKLVLVAIIAAIIIGPTRLPELAQRLADLIRLARDGLETLKARTEAETGMTADDWKELDPRRYDPRRIIREALAPEGGPDAEAVAEPVVVRPAAPTNRSASVTGSSGHPRRLFEQAAAAKPAE